MLPIVKSLLPIMAQVLTSILLSTINRKLEYKQDTKLYIALMISGFLWSQLQTEYLIWRIKKDTQQAVLHIKK